MLLENRGWLFPSIVYIFHDPFRKKSSIDILWREEAKKSTRVVVIRESGDLAPNLYIGWSAYAPYIAENLDNNIGKY